MNWADRDISPDRLKIFWVASLIFCCTWKSLSPSASLRVTKCAWHGLRCSGSRVPAEAAVPAHSCWAPPVLATQEESAANSSKWEDEKSPWVTAWPFSIAGKLRHPRQMTASKPQMARGFQAELGTKFEPSYLDHTSCLMTKMMALILCFKLCLALE